jgi:ribosomal protein L34E
LERENEWKSEINMTRKSCNIKAIRTFNHSFRVKFIKNRKEILKCEWCGEEIPRGEECKVYGKDSQGIMIKIHVYCELCYIELIPEFHKWKNEGSD